MLMELRILDAIQAIRTPLGDVWMPAISALGNSGAIWIAAALLLIAFPKTRRPGMVLACALCLDGLLCNCVLKPLVERIRPCDVNAAVELLIPRPTDYSFPSGHTAASFAAACALYWAGARKMFVPAIVLAVLIAFSRMYLYVHYPTDILGGVVVGVLCGWLGYRCVRFYEARRAQRGKTGSQ